MVRPDWSPEQNRAHFGDLVLDHRHDYECAVTVSGSPDPVTGMIVDLGRLDAILEEEIPGRLAGRRLNDEVEEFAAGRPLPTCEALAFMLYSRIASRLPPGVRLERVRVAEDPTLHAECTGPA